MINVIKSNQSSCRKVVFWVALILLLNCNVNSKPTNSSVYNCHLHIFKLFNSPTRSRYFQVFFFNLFHFSCLLFEHLLSFWILFSQLFVLFTLLFHTQVLQHWTNRAPHYSCISRDIIEPHVTFFTFLAMSVERSRRVIAKIVWERNELQKNKAKKKHLKEIESMINFLLVGGFGFFSRDHHSCHLPILIENESHMRNCQALRQTAVMFFSPPFLNIDHLCRRLGEGVYGKENNKDQKINIEANRPREPCKGK